MIREIREHVGQSLLSNTKHDNIQRKAYILTASVGNEGQVQAYRLFRWAAAQRARWTKAPSQIAHPLQVR